MMEIINEDVSKKYGNKFIKEAIKEQKVSYLHKSTKIPSKRWINKKRKENKCTTGADYSGYLRKNWKFNKNKIINKTKYGSIIIKKDFIKRVHKNVIKH